MSDSISKYLHKDRKKFRSRLPKLPKNTYTLPRNKFLKRIKQFDVSIKRRMIVVWKRVQAASIDLEERKKRGEEINYKLSDLQKAQVIELASHMYKPKQILKIIRNNWKIKYGKSSLLKLLKSHRDIILQKREFYIKNVDSLRLVHERPRIEELTDIFDSAKGNRDRKLQIEALKEIRQEVKGDRLTIDQNLNADINLNVKDHIYKTINIESLWQLAMIKLFEKHKIDSQLFMHRLKIQKEVKDPSTGMLMPNKMLPVAVDAKAFYLDDKDINLRKAVEEKKVNVDKEEIKKKLLEKLKEKMKKVKKARREVEDTEEKLKSKGD